MQPHVRAMIAASAAALLTGRKVAGMYDHSIGRHLRIAAEARGGHLQGYDGDGDARFGGTAPEFRRVGGDAISFTLEADGQGMRGYDRSSACHFTVTANEGVVQLYDHGAGTWFAFGVQTG